MGEKGGGRLGGGGEEGRKGPCHLQACSEFQVPPCVVTGDFVFSAMLKKEERLLWSLS